jgi:ATP-dependent phosphofructokinase / diphosphate-dependent phosphofructokinase
LAGGADVILIPEIPYRVKKIAKAIERRSQHGTNFSIVAVAEGALSPGVANQFQAARAMKRRAKTKEALQKATDRLAALAHHHTGNTMRLAAQLEQLTGLESRVTILGYVQRGGAPSAVDRVLATRLGTACAELIHQGKFGVMVAARGEGTEAVPIERVAGVRKQVPPNHPWIASARAVGTCLGD